MGLMPFDLSEALAHNHAEIAGTASKKDTSFFGINGLAKRVVDIAITLPAIIFLLPVFITAALAVKLCDNGPVIYRQERIGKDGKRFSILKFRTMRTDADQALQELLDRCPDSAEQWNTFQKLRNDPRITAVGGFLRSSSIDELPQLFNILKGDMSLVGQRPILTCQIDDYGIHFAGYTRARPGLTGLWQVKARNAASFEVRAVMGSQYVAEWSLWRDITLMALTVPAVMLSRDAY